MGITTFFRCRLQSPCTALTAGKCLSVWSCKETVKVSTLFDVSCHTAWSSGGHIQSMVYNNSGAKCSLTSGQHVHDIWGLGFQKRVSQAGISNCFPQLLWGAITFPCLRYPLLEPKSCLWYCVNLALPLVHSTRGHLIGSGCSMFSCNWVGTSVPLCWNERKFVSAKSMEKSTSFDTTHI